MSETDESGRTQAIVKAKPAHPPGRAAQSILVALPDDEDRESITRALAAEGYTVFTASRAREALKLLKAADLDLIICDIRFPDRRGVDVLRLAHESHPQLPVLMVAAEGNVAQAVETMKEGAADYLVKPVEPRDFFTRVEKVLSESRKRQELLSLWQDASRRRAAPFIGESGRMMELFDQIRRVAPAKANVLIHGESGTGKELVARSLHTLSPRRERPFMAINCSAFPETLLESELFGHERGAFTGAVERRLGRFELANGGTVFLDEIGEMPLTMQAKLLRVIEEKEFMRLGGDRTIAVDVRIVAATHRDLEALAQNGRFREDLLYRLKVITIEVPPLRDRREDIPLLVEAFLREACEENHKAILGMAPEVTEQLMNYRWPGNVREIRNVIEQMVVLARTPTLTIADLPYPIRGVPPEPSPHGLQLLPGLSMAEIEKKVILATLSAHEGNRTQTAKILGIGLRTLQRKIKEYGLS
ncbi:MAG: sigma-54-dependent Fis family transcriptional regulator [Nitrospirae bacterium]|nr:sigma-54-dependent Fis family transcriptional regulator [Nitrospirota bacterium]